jgi:hypothetical protein
MTKRELLVETLNSKFGITILNDYDLQNNRYWYVDIKNHPHTTPDGDPVRFNSFEEALDYVVTELVEVDED